MRLSRPALSHLLCCLGLAPALAWAQLQGSIGVSPASPDGRRDRQLIRSVSCEPTCDGLVTSGTLRSSLHNSWGQLLVQSLDAQGRVLQETRTAPFQGEFSQLSAAFSLPVAPGARSVRLYAETWVRGPAPRGELSWRDLNVEAGLHTTLEAADSSVAPEGRPLAWQLHLARASSALQLNYQVSDANGRVVEEGSRKLEGGRDLSWATKAQPAGYYQVKAQLRGPQGGSTPLSAAVVVTPENAGAAATKASDTRIGVDAVLSWYGGDAARVARSLRTLKAVGVGALRDRLRWRELQPSATSWQPGHALEVAKQVQAQGLALLWTFHDAPAWTHPSRPQPEDMNPAEDLGALTAFGRKLADTFGPYGQAVEFWNEPNSNFYSGYAYQFSNGLKAFAQGVAASTSGMQVLYGAPVEPPGPFFQTAARNGLGRIGPVANHHFYSAPEGLAAYRRGKGLDAPFQSVHAMPRAWVTETGASVQRGPDGSLDASELQQANYLAKVYAEGLSAGYERIYWLSWEALPEGTLSNWGLLRPDGNPRPALATLAMVSQATRGAQALGVARPRGATVHVFKTATGGYNAVVWGQLAELPEAWFKAPVRVHDTLGRRLGARPERSDSPLFLLGLSSLPTGLGTLEPPLGPGPISATATAAAPRLVGQLQQGDKPLPPTTRNAVIVPVAATGTLVLRLQTLGGQGGEQLVCDPGEGLPLVGTDTTGKDAACRYNSGASTAPQGAVGARLLNRQGQELDRAYVPIGLVADKRLRSSQAGEALLPRWVFCKAWMKKSSGNVKLSLEADGGLLEGCTGVAVDTTTIQAADTWAFPALPTLGGVLKGVKSLQLTLAALPGVPPPPQDMQVQFVNEQGTWLAPLGRLPAGDDPLQREVDLSLAAPAPWRPSTPETFDPATIRSILIGWGGQTTQPGQRFGFRVLDIKAFR